MDLMGSSNLDYMIDLKKRLDTAYSRQYLLVEKSTDLNYLLRSLKSEISELQFSKNRKLSQFRSSNMTSGREKAKGFDDVSKKHLEIAGRQHSEILKLDKKIEQMTIEIEAVTEEIKVTSQLCTDELANYLILKQEYDLLSTGNVEWHNLCASQQKALNELAEQAMIPQRLFDTVVAIPHENGGVRLYFGNKDKVYNKNSTCRIIAKDGTILHRENNKIGVIKKH